MPKPIVRVVFSALIALVLVVGIFTSVQGAMLNASTKSAQAYMGVGVNLGQRHDRNSVQKLDSFGVQADASGKSEGGCHNDSRINPDD